MADKIAFTIVSPMYNEEENVGNTVRRICDEMHDFPRPWELILVNDGSTDGTLDAAKRLEKNVEQLRVVSYPDNRGRGMAMRKGFEAARGEIVATTDFDLSYSPDHLLKIFETFERNPDVDIVLGSAYMPGGATSGVPWKRLAASRLGNMILGFAMGGGLHTITCILRGYRRHVLDMLDLESDGKEIHLEILSKALALGFRVKEIPAHLRGRTGGKSKFRLRATSSTHLLFSFFERPMLIFGVIGALLVLAGLVSGAAIAYMRYAGTLNPERPLMTLTILLVIGGVQVLTIGFVSLQVLALRKEIYKIQGQNRYLLKFIRDMESDSKE